MEMSIVKVVLIALWYYLSGYSQYSFSTRSTLFLLVVIACCTRLSIRLSTRGTRLSTHSICLSTRSTRLAIRLSIVLLVVLSVGLFITDHYNCCNYNSFYPF